MLLLFVLVTIFLYFDTNCPLKLTSVTNHQNSSVKVRQNYPTSIYVRSPQKGQSFQYVEGIVIIFLADDLRRRRTLLGSQKINTKMREYDKKENFCLHENCTIPYSVKRVHKN